MLLTIGWITIGMLFLASIAFIFELARLLHQAKENDQVICEWLAEVEENNNRADALLR